jgi:hypothetical protein
MVFWFLLQLLGWFFFYYCRYILVSRQGLSSNDSQVVLTFCFFILVAPMLTCSKLHRVV